MRASTHSSRSFHPVTILAVVALLLPAAVRAAEPTSTSQDKKPAAKFEVESHLDLAYYTGDDADKIGHKLDVFAPSGARDYPVLFLVHGGCWSSWSRGDKSSFGFYTAVGKFLASRGIGVVVPNYRLSPAVKHPEHIKDVARAFAWTQKNIGKYGGSPDRVVLCGHSAGGHLVALLATDESYLKAEGLDRSAVKGVICISGVYHLPDKGDLQLTTFPIGVGLFTSVFGDDVKVRADASPLTHVCEGLPPFRLFNAALDLPSLPAMSEEFYKALKEKKCDVEWKTMDGREHNTLMFQATSADDPLGKAILEFVEKYAPAK